MRRVNWSAGCSVDAIRWGASGVAGWGLINRAEARATFLQFLTFDRLGASYGGRER